MSNGSSRRLSRGDRRRNEKLNVLRAVVTRGTAVVAFDLAADKQVCAVTDPDFTRNKNDDSDAVVIARLVTELRCYLPERADPVWARLRHLGARRSALVTAHGAARQQVRDLLECAWPAAFTAAGQPLDSKSWLAAMTVLLDGVAATGDLTVVEQVRRRGPPRAPLARDHPLVLSDRARGVHRRDRPRAG